MLSNFAPEAATPTEEPDLLPARAVLGAAAAVPTAAAAAATEVASSGAGAAPASVVVEAAARLLGMEAAFLGYLDDDVEVFVHVASIGHLPLLRHGTTLARNESICGRVFDGHAPTVIADTHAHPEVRDLPAVRDGRIGSYVGAPVRRPDGSSYGMLCCIDGGSRPHASARDFEVLAALADVVGAQLATEEALRVAEQARADALARVTHDLRGPLTAIAGYASLLSARARSPHAETITTEVARLAAMLDELTSGAAPVIERTAFDLAEQAAQQAAVFDAQTTNHQVMLNIPRGVYALGDATRTASVIANLLSNAIKYAPGGGLVEMTISRSKNTVRLAVSDEGVGVPVGQAAAIFTRFFRVQSAATTTIPGTGLGLALARDVIRAQGGDMGFTSTERLGSTFWLELPAT